MRIPATCSARLTRVNSSYPIYILDSHLSERYHIKFEECFSEKPRLSKPYSLSWVLFSFDNSKMHRDMPDIKL